MLNKTVSGHLHYIVLACVVLITTSPGGHY
jgi:hypothetical protein